MTIKVTYNVTDVYVTQDVSPVYINVSYSSGGSGGAAVWGSITGTLSDQTDLQTALDAKVPYTGATQDVSLGEYGINVGNIIYDTTPTGIPTDQGATYWDDQAETVALVMNGTIQKIGEDTFYHVKNSTGSTIAKGVAVRFAGSDGASGKILIAPFLANGTYPSQYYMGITAEEILNGANGKVYHFGKIRGVNTSAFADGDILYCNTTVAGGFQTAAPSAPNNIVIAAAVINAANNGTLMVRTTTGSNINTDEGVLLTTPTSGQVLKYNGSLWVNDSVSGALGYTPANAATTLTINGVTYDLSTSRSWTVSGGISGSGASGQVAYWTGTSAQSGSNNLFWDAANSRLGIGTNTPSYKLHNVGSAGFENGLSGDVLTILNDGFLKWASVRFRAFGSQFIFQDNSYNNKISLSMVGSASIFNTGGNYLFGSTTDSGERLQVTGDVKIVGSGASSGTTALRVQNSSYQNIFRVLNNGEFRLGNGANFIYAFTYSSVYDTQDINGGNFTIYPSNGSITLGGGTQAQTSGNQNNVITKGRFQPSSGTATFTEIRSEPLINQTGGANGITRGLYVNPTLTAAADFRAIETARGNVVFGNLPTSSAGLPTGAIWNDAGTIKIV